MRTGTRRNLGCIFGRKDTDFWGNFLKQVKIAGILDTFSWFTLTTCLRKNTLLVESFAVESFAISRVFSSIAKVNTREIVLSSSFAKCQSKNSKIWHENKKISPKFPSLVKVYTR